jgi:hypothetical protein
MSDRARHRAITQFQWDARVDALLKVYAETISNR